MSNVKPGQLRCGEHTDWGAITLLIQDDVGGLEVKKATVNYATQIKIIINKQTNVSPPRPLHFLGLSIFHLLFVIRNVAMNKNQHELLSAPVILQSCVTGVSFHKKKPIDVFDAPCLLRYTVRCITLLKHVSNQICVKSLSDVSILIFDRRTLTNPRASVQLKTVNKKKGRK